SSGIIIEFGYTLFPNPATDIIYIQIENKNTPISIEIFNSNGQKIIAQEFEYNTDLISAVCQPIEIKNLVQGMYFMKVTCNENITQKKFIVY
ncbi:MAG: T9SS type A sorting domain-containing protein, partial [Bacteroidetes bacterium]|nr:T9SS type A sorting domain-containing protein [Bacteroidota bacterium]